MKTLQPGEVIHTKAYDYTIGTPLSEDAHSALLKVHNEGGRDSGLKIIVATKAFRPDCQIGTFRQEETTFYVLSCNGLKIPQAIPDAECRSFQSGTYVGQLKDDMPHGQGCMKWNNCNTYTGHWDMGRCHGYGIFTQPNGLRYEGYWTDNQQEGMGLCFYPNGNIYEGEFHLGHREGHGILRQPGGGWYEGEFANDLPVRNTDMETDMADGRPIMAEPPGKPSLGYRIWCKTWRLLAALFFFGMAYLTATMVFDFFNGNGASHMKVKGIFAPILCVIMGFRMLISFFKHLTNKDDE